MSIGLLSVHNEEVLLESGTWLLSTFTVSNYFSLIEIDSLEKDDKGEPSDNLMSLFIVTILMDYFLIFNYAI